MSAPPGEGMLARRVPGVHQELGVLELREQEECTEYT